MLLQANLGEFPDRFVDGLQFVRTRFDIGNRCLVGLAKGFVFGSRRTSRKKTKGEGKDQSTNGNPFLCIWTLHEVAPEAES